MRSIKETVQAEVKQTLIGLECERRALLELRAHRFPHEPTTLYRSSHHDDVMRRIAWWSLICRCFGICPVETLRQA